MITSAEELDWEKQIKWFKPEEFDDPDYPGSWKHLDPKTIILMDWLRKNTGWPIITHNKYGLHGCVCVKNKGHALKSRHYITHPDGASAIDFHFKTNAPVHEQVRSILCMSGFTGVGIYYDWHWNNSLLKVGFHVDRRKRFQLWVRDKGKYIYIVR